MNNLKKKLLKIQFEINKKKYVLLKKINMKKVFNYLKINMIFINDLFVN